MNPELRKEVYEKYDGRCAYCGKKIEYSKMQIDHIVSKKTAEVEKTKVDNSLSNLNPSCARCNKWKGGMRLETFRKEIESQKERLMRDSAGFRLAWDFELLQDWNLKAMFYFEMKKELTLHDWALMVGKKVYIDYLKKEFLLLGVKKYGAFFQLIITHSEEFGKTNARDCKPILRTIAQITKEEANEIEKIFNYSFDGDEDLCCTVEWIDWMTQHGLDIRGWIDAGLAIKQEDDK